MIMFITYNNLYNVGSCCQLLALNDFSAPPSQTPYYIRHEVRHEVNEARIQSLYPGTETPCNVKLNSYIHICQDFYGTFVRCHNCKSSRLPRDIG